jgi:hypothetical protein
MYGYNAMEVQEAFIKIKEQARAYLALPLDLQAGGRGGMLLLNIGLHPDQYMHETVDVASNVQGAL